MISDLTERLEIASKEHMRIMAKFGNLTNVEAHYNELWITAKCMHNLLVEAEAALDMAVHHCETWANFKSEHCHVEDMRDVLQAIRNEGIGGKND